MTSPINSSVNSVQKKIRQNAPTAHRDFRLLWSGQTLNLLGDQFLIIALPLFALEVLGSTAAQAALLPFAIFAPFLLFGLPAGAIVDRLPRRIIMIACDSFQALIFTLVAVLAIVGWLNYSLLMVLVAMGGTAVVFFQVAYTSYLPEIFADERDLQKNNSRLFFSESMSRTLGPMLAGPIISFLGATAAIVVNAGTFVLSVVSLLGIKHRAKNENKDYADNSKKAQQREKGWMMRDIREGLSFVFKHPKLEPVIFCGVVYVLFLSVIESSLVIYCKEVLGLSTTSIGLVVGSAAAGFPIGNLAASKLVAKYGSARVLVFSASISVFGLILTPIAGEMSSIVGLVIVSVIHGFGEGIFGPTALTLRQTESPNELLGRVNSVQRFLIWGAIPLGSLLTAATIKLVGLEYILWVGGIGTVLCLPPLIRRGILAELINRKEPQPVQSK